MTLSDPSKTPSRSRNAKRIAASLPHSPSPRKSDISIVSGYKCNKKTSSDEAHPR
jgi:hypothetical protein